MNPWMLLAAVFAIAAAFGGGYYKGNVSGQAEVQQKWDKERARLAEEYALAQEQERLKEQKLQQAADKLRRDKDAEIRDLNARATALSNIVRSRPERSAQAGEVGGPSGDGTAGAVCTGAELPRQDAEFLVGEAARADSLRAALKQCYAQYDAARQTVNKD